MVPNRIVSRHYSVWNGLTVLFALNAGNTILLLFMAAGFLYTSALPAAIRHLQSPALLWKTQNCHWLNGSLHYMLWQPIRTVSLLWLWLNTLIQPSKPPGFSCIKSAALWVSAKIFTILAAQSKWMRPFSAEKQRVSVEEAVKIRQRWLLPCSWMLAAGPNFWKCR